MSLTHDDNECRHCRWAAGLHASDCPTQHGTEDYVNLQMENARLLVRIAQLTSQWTDACEEAKVLRLERDNYLLRLGLANRLDAAVLAAGHGKWATHDGQGGRCDICIAAALYRGEAP